MEISDWVVALDGPCFLYSCDVPFIRFLIEPTCRCVGKAWSKTYCFFCKLYSNHFEFLTYVSRFSFLD